MNTLFPAPLFQNVTCYWLHFELLQVMYVTIRPKPHFVAQNTLMCLPQGEKVRDAWSLKTPHSDCEMPFRLKDTCMLFDCVSIHVEFSSKCVCVCVCVGLVSEFYRVNRFVVTVNDSSGPHTAPVDGPITSKSVCCTSLQVPEVYVCVSVYV